MSSLLHAKRDLERRVPGCLVRFEVDRHDSLVRVSVTDGDVWVELATGEDHLDAAESAAETLDAWERLDSLACASDAARLQGGE